MLEQLLNSGKFSEVLDQIANGEKLPKTLNEYSKSSIFDRLFQQKQFEIIRLFLENGVIETDVYEFDSFDKSIFQSVTRGLQTDDESLAFFREFISKFDNINDEVGAKTLLGYFFEKGASLESIKILVEAGCDVNFKNNAEENFLQQVIKTNLMKPELSLSYLEFLIGEGLDVNAQDIVQKTPLITAIEFNRNEYIDLLLQNGANPNHADKNGNTAFFYAVAHKLDVRLYDLLRNYDMPQLDILNKDQVTLLFEYMRMMYDTSEKSLELLRKLIEDGADIYQTSSYYSRDVTPIDLVAEKKPEVLQALLDIGISDINRQDDSGNTLLHKVCAYNVNYDTEKAKEMYRKVKLLLENGADVSITNDKDQKALDLASDDNLKIKTVELLMKQS
ncbi:ankyrin repeat domain-containing protein [Flavobacterium microcysteis]|uniref:Uncharacterized protein n=1 Tax=Flavobacterium microcysteis TaxID=2596891 RepID=A0A501QHA7_9FLAO|nr:ankyrin repeat domain-containing protein [Flavobacterium microcysteis]TPD71842.1 hypothetical protein FJA49_02900 [Flavobacterium microcysteis]